MIKLPLVKEIHLVPEWWVVSFLQDLASSLACIWNLDLNWIKVGVGKFLHFSSRYKVQPNLTRILFQRIKEGKFSTLNMLWKELFMEEWIQCITLLN